MKNKAPCPSCKSEVEYDGTPAATTKTDCPHCKKPVELPATPQEPVAADAAVIASRRALEAALTDAGISLENLRTEVSQKAATVKQFITTPGDAKVVGTFPNSIWVRDIIAPKTGTTWNAIVSAADSKLYEVDFTLDGVTVNLVGDPREVISQVEYSYVPTDASMASKARGELGAAQPRKDGKFHGAAAATDEAYEASKDSKTALEHTAAAMLHDKAADLHKAAGNDAMAKQHKEKAAEHRAISKTLTAGQSAAANASDNSTPKHFALEGALAIEAPAKFDEFMVMAGGVQTVTLGIGGKPLTITVDVNAAGAKALQAQLETVNGNTNQRVFNCFDHEKKAASAWPKKFFWRSGSKPGIYESAEPSKAGLDAVSGKSHRGFSMTFFTDADITETATGYEIQAGAKGSSENPAHIICPDDAAENPTQYLNMGTLTNRPAFARNEPLFASTPGRINSPTPVASVRPPGAQPSSKTESKSTPMKNTELDATALQARNEQLEQRIQELEAQDTAISKAELKAAQAELEANRTKMELAAAQAKNTELEAGETKRKEFAADEAVKDMINSQQIPQLDKEMQASYRDKFIKDPTLIPLIVRKAAPSGRVAPGATGLEASRKGMDSIELGFECGGAMKSLLTILNANSRIRITRGMSKSQIEAAYEEKGKLALKAGLFYKQHLGKKVKEWEDIPAFELAKLVGLDASMAAAPNLRALEAADFVDPNNQLGTLSGTLVLQRTLPLFAYDYPELTSMYTDFSDTPGLLNQTEDTRIVIVPAVQKYNSTKDAAGRPLGWSTVSPAQTVDAPITLSDYIAVPIVFGQDILSETTRRLFDEQSAAGIKAIGGYFTNMMTKLLTPANFQAYAAVTAPNGYGIQTVPVAYSTYAKGIQDWSMTDLDKLSAIFTQNQVPRSDRGILLSPNYYAKLRSDARLEFFFAAAKGDPQLTQQKLPDGLSGFFPYEAPYLPSANNLAFFPYHKAAIILKSRLPMDFTQALGVMIPGSVTTITDPDTKISVALVQYVNLTQNYAEWRPEVQLGAGLGDIRGGLAGTTQ